MNQLPTYRQIINGRTHARSWSAAEMDPIEGPTKLERLRWLRLTSRLAERSMFVLALTVIAVLCARA